MVTMRAVPMEHNTRVNPYSCDHASYLHAIGYTDALRAFSAVVAQRDSYAATWPRNDLYRTHMRRFAGRARYWRTKVDTIIREHSCSVCNCWTGTHYLHARNVWVRQQRNPEYICDACLADMATTDS